jgi:HAD superfamily hydrolase (TIGR01549 family)
LKIQAVLLDVAGVLVDEIETYKWLQGQLLELLQQEGFNVSSEELEELLRQAWRRCLAYYSAAVLWHYVKPDVERFQRLRQAQRPLHEFYKAGKPQLMPGAKEIVASLNCKYRLALAGNQPVQIKEFLQSQGILQYFEYGFVSEELRVYKPDPLFFQIILDRLGVSPEEAVMVGDRLDNDIFPAKMLGLKTVRLLVWPFSLQEARIPAEMPDLTIRKFSELPKAIEELSRTQGEGDERRS